MQSVSSRIWTRVAVSISYDDNDYTTGTSRLDMTSRFMGSDFPTVRDKVTCCKSLDHSVARSRTAQLPGSYPHALQVAIHSQQVALLQSVYYSSAADKAVGIYNHCLEFQMFVFFNIIINHKQQVKKANKKNVPPQCLLNQSISFYVCIGSGIFFSFPMIMSTTCLKPNRLKL